MNAANTFDVTVGHFNWDHSYPSPFWEGTEPSLALGIFRASRILAEVLEKLYSVPSTLESSYDEMRNLERKLNKWYEYVKGFIQPNVAHSRSSQFDLATRYSVLVSLAAQPESVSI